MADSATLPPEIIEQREHIKETVDFIKSQKPDFTPEVGLILGTGMGALAGRVEDATKISYDQIPHFPVSTVESHHGNLLLGTLGGKKVFMMQGRFHRYEGYSLKEVTYPVRIMKAIGCQAMIVMNAVGSMNPLIGPGSLVFATDHINLMGDNPLIGANDDELGPRFPDMSKPYHPDLVALGEQVALERKLKVHKGVLVAVTGPNLETAAEYRAFRRMGADLVTMSTIPEVIVAVHSSLPTVAISTVTDACLPDDLHEAKVEEIIKVAGEAEPRLSELVTGILEKMTLPV
jgi:purine-nucleoside phosphorylase